MKTRRQDKILSIILENEIETQAQLIEELERCGMRSTQATLSRDIKDLRLVKELSPSGRYCYAVSKKEELTGHNERLRMIFRESVVSCDTAMNLVVVKTLPGLAMAASSALDSMGIEGLVGTVAGDDTAFIAMRDIKSAELLKAEIVESYT